VRRPPPRQQRRQQVQRRGLQPRRRRRVHRAGRARLSASMGSNEAVEMRAREEEEVRAGHRDSLMSSRERDSGRPAEGIFMWRGRPCAQAAATAASRGGPGPGRLERVGDRGGVAGACGRALWAA
jgi:hypothetical protein